MKRKKFVKVILIIIVLLLTGALGYFGLMIKPQISPEQIQFSDTKETEKNLAKDDIKYREYAELPSLAESTALSLVKTKWGDCTLDQECLNISVAINPVRNVISNGVKKKDNVWYITATYEGLKNDSRDALRYFVPAYYENNTWVLGEPITITQRCWPGRGHQDFSKEPCL